MKRAWGLVGLLVVFGCGGEASENGGSGGDASTGGVVSSGGTVGGSSGGGGGAAVGGAASDSGGATASGGQSGGSGGDASGGAGACPTVPVARLLPWIGPFQYGPDPGPCSQTGDGKVSTYHYEGDRPTELRGESGEVLESYTLGSDGRITAYEVGTSSNTVVYEEDRFNDIGEGSVTTYHFDTNGYVTRAEVDRERDGTIDSQYTYEYENCRMVRVRESESGLVYRGYKYDSVGHILAFTAEETGPIELTFDYSCWKE